SCHRDHPDLHSFPIRRSSDLWIRWLMGSPCEKTSSFGSLQHFKKENKPEGAASRCLECPVDAGCPYSANKIYLVDVRSGNTGWRSEEHTSELQSRENLVCRHL